MSDEVNNGCNKIKNDIQSIYPKQAALHRQLSALEDELFELGKNLNACAKSNKSGGNKTVRLVKKRTKHNKSKVSRRRRSFHKKTNKR